MVRHRDELNLEILRLQQLVKALSRQTGKDQDLPVLQVARDVVGFTEAVTEIRWPPAAQSTTIARIPHGKGERRIRPCHDQ
jgi:hypothetical protein